MGDAGRDIVEEARRTVGSSRSYVRTNSSRCSSASIGLAAT